MELTHLLAKINQTTCPFCDGYMGDFTRAESPQPISHSRSCLSCSQDNMSYVIISFQQDKPFFLISSYQDFTATLFFPITSRPTYYTKLFYKQKLFGVIDNWPEIDPSQPQQFLRVMQTLGLLS